MPSRQTGPELAAGWCGHLGGYEIIAMLCGRRGASDRLVRCRACSREYLASELAAINAARQDAVGQGGQAAAGTTTSHLAHERARPTGGIRSMSVPTSPTGNPDARQQAQPQDRQTEDLGEGHIMGNLTQDPELRYTPTGRAVARLRVAWTPRIKNPQTSQYHDGPTEYYDLEVWGQQGERCAEQLLKGDRVVATGNWIKRMWKDNEGGDRVGYCLTARDIGPSLLFRGAVVDRTKTTEGGADRG